PAVPDTASQILALQGADPNLRTVFRVKYVADGVAYLDGGRSQGLAEGMKLEVKDTDIPPRQGAVGDPNDPRVVAELLVSGVADSSAVTDIHTPRRPVKAGDLAYLSEADAAALVQQRTLSATRKYPAVVSFTEGDTLDEAPGKKCPNRRCRRSTVPVAASASTTLAPSATAPRTSPAPIWGWLSALTSRASTARIGILAAIGAGACKPPPAAAVPRLCRT